MAQAATKPGQRAPVRHHGYRTTGARAGALPGLVDHPLRHAAAGGRTGCGPRGPGLAGGPRGPGDPDRQPVRVRRLRPPHGDAAGGLHLGPLPRLAHLLHAAARGRAGLHPRPPGLSGGSAHLRELPARPLRQHPPGAVTDGSHPAAGPAAGAGADRRRLRAHLQRGARAPAHDAAGGDPDRLSGGPAHGLPAGRRRQRAEAGRQGSPPRPPRPWPATRS